MLTSRSPKTCLLHPLRSCWHLTSVFRTATGTLLLAGIALAGATPETQAQTTAAFTTLHKFGTGEGQDPQSNLVQGTNGYLYGTNQAGGDAHSDGVAYKITPAGAVIVLHLFTDIDGHGPSSKLLLGSDGNLYGTTKDGGANNGVSGTVFKMTPAGTITTLHTFTGGTDGTGPADLVEGSDGNFYGDTGNGFGSNAGTIFKVTATGVFTTLHTFPDNSDEVFATGLTEGKDGNFYGTATDSNGQNSTIFKVTTTGVYTSLYTLGPISGTFGASTGVSYTSLALGNDGNFYGTTSGGGANDDGIVFKVTPSGTFTNLHSLNASEGYYATGLVKGNDGNFYTTTGGGGANSLGTIFQVTPKGVLTVLHTFAGGGEGGTPIGGLTQASDGTFYGTTDNFSSDGADTIFKLTVAGVHPFYFTGEAALGNGVYYLSFPTGNYFGYYSYLTDPHYIYHFDLGYEYVFDAADGRDGVYLYDFKSKGFFYTSPSFPFPYMYDFSLNSVVYYYPDPSHVGHYNTNGVRYFYVFKTGKIISK